MLNTPVTLQGLKVLLVEDNPHTMMLTTDLLELEGAIVTIASTQTEAENLLGQNQFDVILCNLRLPDGDGYTLVRWLRQQEAERRISSTPAIAITASVGDSHRVEALASGFQDYVTKPYEFDLLVQAITNALKQ